MAKAETFVQYVVEKRMVRKTNLNEVTLWQMAFSTEFLTGSFWKKNLQELIGSNPDYRIKTVVRTTVTAHVEADGEVGMYVPSERSEWD